LTTERARRGRRASPCPVWWNRLRNWFCASSICTTFSQMWCCSPLCSSRTCNGEFQGLCMLVW
jgi:hypothetical protein